MVPLSCVMSCRKMRASRFAPIALGLLCLAFARDERLGSVKDVYDGNLPLDVEVNTFRHIDRVFPSASVRHGSKVAPLMRAPRQLEDVTLQSAGEQLRGCWS